MSLFRIVGLPFDTKINVDDQLNDYVLDENLFEGILASNRIEYRILKNQLEMSNENVKMIRADYLPTAGVQLDYNYTNVVLQDVDNYDLKGFSGTASVSIPITTFGERKGKMSSAKADVDIKELELKQTAELLQLETEQARFNYIDAYTRIDLQSEAVEQAQENMRITGESYKLGLETIVNLLESQIQW